MTEPPATTTPARPTAGLTAVLVISSVALIVGIPIVVLGTLDTDGLEHFSFVGVLLLLLSLLLLTPLPLTFGLILATGFADWRTPDGRKAFRRLLFIAATLVLGLSSALIAAAATGVLPLLSAIVISLACAAFTAGAIWLGDVIRQRDALRSPLPWPSLETRLAKVPQRTRWVYWSFLIAFGLTAAAVAVAFAITHDASLLRPGALLNAIAIPLLIAGVTGGVIFQYLLNDIAALLGPNHEQQQRLVRAAQKRSVENLEPHERPLARRYAGAAAALVPIQLAQFLGLALGVGAMRLGSLVEPNDNLRAWDIAFLVIIVAATAVLVPWVLRRGRLQREFATAADEPPPTSPQD